MGIVTLDIRRRAARDPRRTGGKGAGLAQLHALGFSVPPGFVLTASAFGRVVEHLRATARDEELEAGDLPAPFERGLRARAQRLGGPFAVRSSLVGEDSARTSMAGQLVSVLDVADEAALVAAVKRCYASAFGPRLAIYRHHIGGGPGSGAGAEGDGTPSPLAVVVQRMQPSRAGGVAFSADPITGQRCVIVEAAAGRPDAVAGGRVNPARWRVDARGVLVEAGKPDSGGRLPAPESILKLAADVRRIAGRLVDPVDVEWLWDGERFWFLQARPITTLAGRHIYSSRLVADMSPGLVKPLLWSTNSLGMARNVFGRIFDELLGPTGLDYGRLIRRIHSRLYADTTMLGELLVRLGLPANFFEAMARDERAERPRIRLTPRRLLRMRRVLPFLRRMLRSKGAIREHLARQGEALDRFRDRDWSGRPRPELLARVRDLQDLHGRSQWFIFLAAFNSMVRKRMLDRMVRRHAPGVDPADLIRGLAGVKSFEPNLRLQKLAAIADTLPDDQRAMLVTGDVERIEASLPGTAAGRQLLTGFDSFMRKFGFLSANGSDFSEESWWERPEQVWRIVVRDARGIHTPPTAETSRIRREARARVRAQLHPLQRGIFRRLLRSTMTYLELRERVSLLHCEDAYEMRRLLLALGRGLAEEEILNAPNDIFFLYDHELASLVAGGRPAARARKLVAERREELADDAKLPRLDTICGETPSLRRPDTELGPDCLMGIGGSSGVVEGRARIVHDPLAAPPDLGPLDILVVPFTDVGWTPLFAHVGGIVAETGGQLSHTAIIAREYNLPAVVSVPDVTRQLGEFEPVTVDGQSGKIYRGHVLGERKMPA